MGKKRTKLRAYTTTELFEMELFFDIETYTKVISLKLTVFYIETVYLC